MKTRIARRGKYFRFSVLAMVLVFLLAACQPAATAPAVAQKPTTAPMPTVAPTATSAPAPTKPVPSPTVAAMDDASLMVVEDAKLGKILADGKGMTLYMYTKDEPDKTNCNEACLKNWPPLLTKGNPKLGPGIDPKLIGSAQMADGSRILTYNKMPLYYFVKDTKAGDTTGQGVNNVWYVVSPDGKPVGMQAPASSPTVPAAKEPTIKIATDPKLGKILVDDMGMTLYMFTKDEPGKSNCVDACLTNWPPLITQGKPNLGEGVDPAKIGTATLSDGRKIVTYNKMPLYYFAKDTKAGDTTGQGVNNVWFVVAP